ncbi:MAG: HlyD family type I secretion periplasmic adaptor subunit [Magnetococcales bacterium]|nr:HlyD family type I secretion periplasmic adaptor subunit [Magnetococcales bacterium]NGZ06522.1 HlyD family type I secretion periplasmic adaptor subunit [Magnetococcales bacterium]
MTNPDTREKGSPAPNGRSAPVARSLTVAIGRPPANKNVQNDAAKPESTPKPKEIATEEKKTAPAPPVIGMDLVHAGPSPAPTREHVTLVSPLSPGTPPRTPVTPPPVPPPAPPSPETPGAAPVALPPVEVPPAPESAPTAVPPHVPEPPRVDLEVLKPDKKLARTMKQGTKQRRYLAQSVVLEESGLSELVRLSLIFMATVVILFFVWATFARMEEMASTSGEVMPAGAVQLIQHLEGGIVKATLIHEGQLVEAGQLLFQMAPEAALADYNQMRARLASLEAQIARNRAFLADKEPDFVAVPAEFAQLIRDQKEYLGVQRASRDSRREVLVVRVQQRRTRIGSLTTQRNSLAEQLRSLDEEVTMRRSGLAMGLTSRLAVMGSERERSRVAGELDRTRADLVTAQKELDEAVKQLESFDDELRQDVVKELNSLASDMSQLREGMLRQHNRVERLEVRAPLRGVIKNLQMETLRGVVPPGGLLTELVPVEATRRVTTHISTRDIGHVKVGQRVTVKVTTYDFSRYGGIEGVLESVSATTFKDPADPTPYFKGIIRLHQSYVGSDPKRNEVLPGMAVQADIHTGSKTLMEYMLKPIYASVDKAFRER